MTVSDGTWYVVTRVGKRPWDLAHRLRLRDKEDLKLGVRTTKCEKRGQVVEIPAGMKINACEKCRVR